MPLDTNRTLEQLEGRQLGDPEFGSALVEKAHRLYRQPLSAFTIEDLRLMISQELGLEFLVPLAIDILEKDPLAGGDYYPGDLLFAVLRIRKDFWKLHRDLYWRICELTADLPPILFALKESIEEFQAQSS